MKTKHNEHGDHTWCVVNEHGTHVLCHESYGVASGVAEMHRCDADCAPYLDTDDQCVVCGVSHTGDCLECGGRGFHAPGCSDNDETAHLHSTALSECGEVAHSLEKTVTR